MSAKQFEDQVAIVTGAGEGIGLAIADALADQGAAVVLNDIDEDKAAAAVQIITSRGDSAVAIPGDAGDLAVIRSLTATAVDQFGRLDIAVANAGITLWNNFFDYDPSDFAKVLSVNLGGSFFLAQTAARIMRDQGDGGRILFMSSVAGIQAIDYLSVYGMTKAALRMLARSLVLELGPLGITVNAVAPGATVTPRNLADDPNYEQSWGKLSPTRRAATVADIASAALFLLSPAAGQINGQTIVVDGGWTSTSAVPPLDFVEK